VLLEQVDSLRVLTNTLSGFNSIPLLGIGAAAVYNNNQEK
jgi:hypothetical protein